MHKPNQKQNILKICTTATASFCGLCQSKIGACSFRVFVLLLRQMVLQCTNAKEHLVLMSGILAALTNWQYFNTQGMKMGWLFLSALMEI